MVPEDQERKPLPKIMGKQRWTAQDIEDLPMEDVDPLNQTFDDPEAPQWERKLEFIYHDEIQVGIIKLYIRLSKKFGWHRNEPELREASIGVDNYELAREKVSKYQQRVKEQYPDKEELQRQLLISADRLKEKREYHMAQALKAKQARLARQARQTRQWALNQMSLGNESNTYWGSRR